MAEAIAPAGAPRRIVELDGLRGLAIILVLLHHFASAAVTRFPVGIVGVRIFFALSGFLITEILLQTRRRIESRAHSAGFGIGRFYVRRLLRLMPVLYIAVIASALLRLGAARSSWPWDLAYLSNAYAIHLRDLKPGLGHLWTLSIEEQFYLVWPWIILFTPRKYLVTVIVATIVVAPLFRTIGALARLNWTWYYCTPPGASDALGYGALLACWKGGNIKLGRWIRRLEILGWTVGAPVAAIGLWIIHWRVGHADSTAPHWMTFVEPVKFYERAVTDTGMSLFGFSTVARLVKNPQGTWAAALRTRPLVYLGTISYGLYVYHVPLKAFYSQYALRWRPGLPAEDTAIYFFLLTGIAIFIASASWFFIEKPIARFKQRLVRQPTPIGLTASSTA